MDKTIQKESAHVKITSVCPISGRRYIVSVNGPNLVIRHGPQLCTNRFCPCFPFVPSDHAFVPTGQGHCGDVAMPLCSTHYDNEHF
jgi:hypothetical protein